MVTNPSEGTNELEGQRRTERCARGKRLETTENAALRRRIAKGGRAGTGHLEGQIVIREDEEGGGGRGE